MLAPPPATAEALPGGSIMVYVVIVEPPSELFGMLLATDSWEEVVVTGMLELENVRVNDISIECSHRCGMCISDSFSHFNYK